MSDFALLVLEIPLKGIPKRLLLRDGREHLPAVKMRINTEWFSPRLVPSSSCVLYHSYNVFQWYQFQNNLEIKVI